MTIADRATSIAVPPRSGVKKMTLCIVMVLAMAQSSLSYGATLENSRTDSVAPTWLNWHKLELQLEASQLLTLLSNPDQLLSERPAELCVFDRKHVYRVGFRTLGRVQLDVDYLQLAAGQETRVRRTMEALHVALTSRPLAGAREDVGPFSLLGLQDEIHLLLSEPERILLQVRGQVPGFGMINLELKKLTR
jgi:hypothetical protein